jgi:hypothetical protein
MVTNAEIITGRFLNVRAGCELLDEDLNLVQDISDTMVLDGQIEHTSFNRIAGTCKLTFDADYLWHINRFRPYLVLTDEDGNEAQYNMGVYMLNTPRRATGKTPARYEAEGYDLISLLDTPYGSSYSLPQGSSYLSTIASLLDAAGVPSYDIDQTAAASTTPMDLLWRLDNDNTWLKIINDLLLGIGYLELYCDRNGTLQAKPFLFPQDKSAVWVYDTESATTIALEELQSETDLHEIPNKWIFRRNVPSQALPTEGDGLYTVINSTDSQTSTGERGSNRPPVTIIIDVDTAYTQTELEITGDRIVDRMKQPSLELTLSAGINPTHFHYEVVTVTAPALGLAAAKFYVESWTLPIGSNAMQLTLRKVV